MAESDQIFIINKLAVVLKEKRKTSKWLAEQLGYKQPTVSNWTRNVIQPPPHTFLRIALILDVNLPDLFANTKDLSKTEKAALLVELENLAEKSKRRK